MGAYILYRSMLPFLPCYPALPFLLVFGTWCGYNIPGGRSCPITWDYMKLPGVAQEIADVIGRERALYLIGKLPRCLMGSVGRKSMQPMLYVPKRLVADGLLVRLLGAKDAQALVDAFGGECLKPPTCSGVYRMFRDREIVAMLADGMTPHLVADVVGVTERWVRHLARENPPVSRTSASNDNAGSLTKAIHA